MQEIGDGAWENCGRVVQVGERRGGVGCGAVEGFFLDEADAGQVFGVVGTGAEERERLGECKRAGNGTGAGGGGGSRRGGGGERDYEEAAGVDPDLGGGAVSKTEQGIAESTSIPGGPRSQGSAI